MHAASLRVAGGIRVAIAESTSALDLEGEPQLGDSGRSMAPSHMSYDG